MEEDEPLVKSKWSKEENADEEVRLRSSQRVPGC